MKEQHSLVISAFHDGEAVDPDALSVALADPDARAFLVDLVRMREAIRQPDPLPASLGALREPAAKRRFAMVPMPVAAAVLVAAVLLTAFLPRPWREASADTPPVPTQVLRFEPGVDWLEKR